VDQLLEFVQLAFHCFVFLFDHVDFTLLVLDGIHVDVCMLVDECGALASLRADPLFFGENQV